MLFKDLEDMVHSNNYVKLFLVDHIHPGFMTGYVANPRLKEGKNGKNIPYIDLIPYTGLVASGPDSQFHLIGYPSECDITYHGLPFQGRFATTDFNYHKIQVNNFIDQLHKAGLETPDNLKEYFKMAKSI